MVGSDSTMDVLCFKTLSVVELVFVNGANAACPCAKEDIRGQSIWLGTPIYFG